MSTYSKLIKIGFINLVCLFVGITILELNYGRWLKIKTFVPNIVPEHGISHDLRLLGKDWGITTRIPNKNGATVYSNTNGGRHAKGSTHRCSLIVLGGSTTEERILNREDTWTYQLFKELNKQADIQQICPKGMSITNAAVNGHSIVANYFDVVYWISRFNQRYSTAIIYQGINDFQGDILESPDWYDLYWQHLTFGLRYNSIFLRVLDSLGGNRFKWESLKSGYGSSKTVLVNPYPKDHSEWESYSIDPAVYRRLSVGLKHHGKYIRLLAGELKKLGVSHTVWITQTKPFCNLSEMPHTIVVKGSKTTQHQLNTLLSRDADDLKSWIAHDRLGDCIRLGLIRSSYLNMSSEVGRIGLSGSIIDYGSSIEKDSGSYDEYHKTPSGSMDLWKEFVRMGLLRVIIDHMLGE